MLRVMGAVLIVLSGSLAGFYYSGRLKKRCDILQEFSAFLAELKTRIRYSGADIFSLLSSLEGSNHINAVIDFVNQNKDSGKSLPDLWEQAVTIAFKGSPLKESDRKAMIQFGETLGTADVCGELAHIDLYVEIFDKLLKSAGRELNEKSKLYKTLGFFAGTSIALMIV
ncbi:MAG: stage III sporulation protein AB [Ruminococcus sp.]|nr:stage III sporulation protein AB [Ruminococcus sp.]